MNSLTTSLCRALALLIAASGFSARAGVPLPAESAHLVPLEGPWRFKLEQALPPPRFLGVSGRPIPIIYPTNIEPFYLNTYHEQGAWQDLSVPGNWEMAGLSPATYHQPDNASGLYRRWFELPSNWKGRLVKINFDGVQNGCEVWCNGQAVPVDECSWGRTNYHESGWTAWQADLTTAVKFGQSNLLALRVVKNTPSVDCDTGDFFLLGGVYRPVTLFALPPTFVQDLTVQTKLLPNREAELHVTAQLNETPKGATVSLRLEDEEKVTAEPDGSGRVVFTRTLLHPRLWSAEFPNLYALSLELNNPAGEVTERITRRVGIREISIQDGVFCVNHVPVKLVGICRHDVYPDLGSAVGPEVWKKDLTLMKAANFNAIRTSHYPYGSGFYDLCDQMGFYVIDEEPFCWVDCADPALRPAFEQRTRETVERDKNHPSVVIWGIGNENKPGPNSTFSARLTREMDPTRPRLVSSRRADEAGADVEFDDAHYVTPQQIRKAEHDRRRTKWPMLYTENPNVWDVRNGPDYGSLELWGAVIERTWQELWKDEHVAGTFLWEWQDRAVADKCPTKFYYFFPETGLNLVKIKGVVDGFRNPRPEYYHIKMAQSPIALGLASQTADGVLLSITNRYSFTDLKNLRVQWRLLGSGHTLREGTRPISCPPRSHGTAGLDLPPDTLTGADTLQVTCDHPSGWNVATYEFPLKVISYPRPRVTTIPGLTFPAFHLVSGKRVRDGKDWWRLDATTGVLTNLVVRCSGKEATAMSAATLTNTPFFSMDSLEADVLLEPGSPPAGHLSAERSANQLNYRFTWSAEKADIYELGWVFQLPRGTDRLSWDRDAAWSYYPPDHIGRPRGTATPDSMKVDVTRVDRAEAFDFNSTKFNCNWTSLTDGAGNGLCLLFPPAQRHHVRGGLVPGGACSLIVDRCYSPPRDISSAIVPDLYTVLQKGGQVLGSFQLGGSL